MANYIIECRNKEALVLNPSLGNGDFNTTIQDKILLEEGDTIMLKSAYIDTKATSEQKIIIDEPLGVSIDFITYVMNQFGTANMTADSVRTILDPSNPLNPPITEKDPSINDGRLYLQCSKSGGVANLRELKGIQFDCASTTTNGGNYGGFNCYCNFTDVNGVKQSLEIQIPKLNSKSKPSSQFYNFDCQFLSNHTLDITGGEPNNNGTGGNGFVMGGTGIPSGQGNAPVYQNTTISFYKITDNFPNDSQWSNDLSGVDHFKAVVSTFNFDIETGNYDPTDLCELINRKMNAIGGISGSNLSGNPFFKGIETSSTSYFVSPVHTLAAGPLGGNNLNNDFRYQYNKDGGIANYNGVWIGASQITINFEPSTQKFEWEYIHSPYIASATEVAGYEDFTQNDGTKDVRAVSRHAGIMFKDLRARNKKTGLPVEFWSKTLGFDIEYSSSDCILAQYSSQLNVEDDAGAGNIGARRQCYKPVFDPQPAVGTTITSNYQGIDTAYQKTDKFWQVPAIGQSGQAATSFFSTSTKTTAISAGDSVLSQDDKMSFGYYLIEVRANFQNNYLTFDENRRNVMAIVSRYYFKDAYTSATSDDSLIYTHSGEPMLLSSFDIRILDSDKVLANNIGSDNTIFLNIIKQLDVEPPKKNKND